MRSLLSSRNRSGPPGNSTLNHRGVRRYIAIITLLVSVPFLIGCGGSGPSSVLGALAGLMFDLDTGHGHPSVDIDCESKDRARSRAKLHATTDSDGRFTLTNIPTGQYKVTATDPTGKYQTITFDITVEPEITADIHENGMIPVGVTFAHMDVVLPPKDSSDGTSYLVGHVYPFKVNVITGDGKILTGWHPNWSLTGIVGSIDPKGTFRPTQSGTGHAQAYFYRGATRVFFDSPEFNVEDP